MRPFARRSFVAALTVGAVVTVAQVGFSGDEPPPPSPADMMKKMAEASALGKHHAELGARLGAWDVDIEVMGMPSKGSCECTWLMEGRFLQERLKGSMMGAPMETVSIQGWDNVKKKFTYVALNSMETAIRTAEGVVVDPTGKVQVSYGTLDEYLTGEHDKPVKYVHRTLGPDKRVLEVWDLGIGETGQVVVKFTYTRKK